MAQVQRIRRVRIGGAIRVQPKSIRPEDEKRMHKLLQSIANIDRTVLEAAAERAREVESLYALMKTYRIPVLEDGGAIATIERPKGRATSVIDVRQFWDRVDEEEFFSAVKVSKEGASKVLSGKELEEITEVTPGKLGNEQLTVKLKTNES